MFSCNFLCILQQLRAALDETETISCITHPKPISRAVLFEKVIPDTEGRGGGGLLKKVT